MRKMHSGKTKDVVKREGIGGGRRLHGQRRRDEQTAVRESQGMVARNGNAVNN